MRKLYAFITGFVLSLVLLQAAAQNDVTNSISIVSDKVVSENSFTATSDEDFTDSCRAEFTIQPVNSNPLGRYFTALPWHSSQKRPEKICWYFGDNKDTCILYDPANPPANGYSVYHQYAQPGNYNVCVKIFYQGGCLAYYCHQITIGDPDSCGANFQVLASTANPLSKYFVAQPSHNHNKKPIKICWNFGDNRDTCIQYSTSYTGPYAVNHTYAHGGNYNVCEKIFYDGGCIAEYCRIVEVREFDSCGANFQVLSVTINPLGKYFVAQPSHNNNKRPIKVCWNFGDGRDTCITYNPGNPPPNGYAVYHQYAHAGAYNVCVKIFYDGGCIAEYCRVVQVGEPDYCSANFQVLSVSSSPLGKYFIAQPFHNHNKKPIKICWNFGDGRDSCIQYPVSYTGSYAIYHLYAHAGNYNVCVNILYDGGCEAHYCRLVQVGNPQDSCRANFEVVSTSANPLNKYFVAQPWHSNNKKPIKVCWNFGDNRDTCINYPTTYTGPYAVNHIYSQPGNYNVCVKILYDGGCLAEYCKQVQVGEPDHCAADFERIQTTNNSLNAYFRALPWHNNNKKPARICWEFGDNRDTCINYPENYTGQYVVAHTYAQPGEYEVCVKILYYGGCEARKCKIIRVPLEETCSVQLFESTPSITSLTRSFLAIPSSNFNRRVETICWYFGDGRDTCISPPGPGIIPSFTITHTYPGPGVYHPCVKVIFAGGCIAQKCIEIVIRSSVDICGGFFTDSLTGPRTYKFRGQGIQNQNDHVISYVWTFGDGTTAIGQEVSHTFNQGGPYNVCLMMYTQQGCQTKICRPLQVGSNVPTLTLSPNPVITNLHVVFISTFTETVNIRIVNSNGVTVRTTTRNAVIGSNAWDFDLTTLIPGLYSFVVQSPNQLASAIFMKQ